jgi:hypothetical protein
MLTKIKINLQNKNNNKNNYADVDLKEVSYISIVYYSSFMHYFDIFLTKKFWFRVYIMGFISPYDDEKLEEKENNKIFKKLNSYRKKIIKLVNAEKEKQ